MDLLPTKRMLPWNTLCVPQALPSALVLAVLVTCAQAQEHDGTQQALNILERRCLNCHNDIDQKGELSFETPSGLLDGGLIDLDAPSDSHLLTVVTSIDGEPPTMPKDGAPLADEEVAILKQWIEQGAPWEAERRLKQPVNNDFNWWSLRPLTPTPVPEIEPGSAAAAWIRTPVDAFIAAQHQDHGLSFSPRADRRTLIRRLYYDLIGLPPSPEEINRFVNDHDPHAWDALIDRLLLSDHYGERWARHWLDVVKYADTCGYDKDKLRPNAWPYRDYVIQSMNADKPYARFVQEQVAGDVLFPEDPGSIPALGFIAAGPWDFIGHAEVPETKIDGQVARNMDRDDMVSNTLNTFCSVTIQCARCHNHKFDPFTQEHYYSLQSIFAAVDKADRPWDADASLHQRRTQMSRQLDEAVSRLTQLEDDLKRAGGAELRLARERLAVLKKSLESETRPTEYGYHSQIAADVESVKWVEVDLGRPVTLKEVRLRACSDDFGGIGAGFGFPVRFRLEAADRPFDTTTAMLLADYQSADFSNPGLDPVTIEAGGKPVRYLRVTATRLATRSNDYIFALSELEAVNPAGTNLAAGCSVTALDSIEAPVRWRKSNLTDGLYPHRGKSATVAELTQAEQEHNRIMAKVLTPELRTERHRLQTVVQDLSKQLKALPAPKMVYAAATNFKPRGTFKPTKGIPRTVRLLHRGNVTQPLDEVFPGVIPVSAGTDWRLALPDDHVEGDRRAALARWLTSSENPLTWRSIVNRIWQYHFGQPIVPTPNDFGRMGQRPTHPELLDWLAMEFRDNGQSFKHLHRLILKSAVWQQASIHNQEAAASDASNQFLWRQNRRRLSAEELRDSILAVSGRLNLKMGGPGFYLFALEKTDHSPHYEYHKFDPADETSHRRSIYRFIVRSQPDPLMTTLDCADSSQSTPRRTETFTPLQALSLLNNPFTMVMADSFSQRLHSECETSIDAVRRAFSLCTGREPSPSELEAMVQYVDSHGMPAFSRVMFNLNEFIFID